MKTNSLKMGSLLMTIGGAALIPYGLIYIWTFLYGEDLEYGLGTEHVDVTKAEIAEFSQSFFNYLAHVHIDVGILMISLGLTVAMLSWFGVQTKQKWAYWSAINAYLLTMIIGALIHYPYELVSHTHINPIWAATGIFVVGSMIAYPKISL